MAWICLWFCLFSLILAESPCLWCILFFSLFIHFTPFYPYLPLFNIFYHLLIPFYTLFSLFFFYGLMYPPCLLFWRKREKWAKKYAYACGWVSVYLFAALVVWLCCVLCLILLPAKCGYAFWWESSGGWWWFVIFLPAAGKFAWWESSGGAIGRTAAGWKCGFGCIYSVCTFWT